MCCLGRLVHGRHGTLPRGRTIPEGGRYRSFSVSSQDCRRSSSEGPGLGTGGYQAVVLFTACFILSRYHRKCGNGGYG